MTPEVMVSYSSQERAQVLQIVQRLRSAGVAVWIDQGGIDGAQRWGEEIVNAIDACKTVILMVSRASMQSENIAREVALAWETKKRFLPLCLEDAKIPASMQYQLAGIQHIKLYEGDQEQKFLTVLRALVRLGVHVSPYYVAVISAEVGDREQAFEWLNRAVEEKSLGLRRLKTEGRFSSLRTDPRFVELSKRVETMEFEDEDISAQIPIVVPRPIPQPIVRTGPEAWWKKLLWPDITDDRSARWAAALGVGAALLLVVCAIFSTFFVSSSTAMSTMLAFNLGGALSVAFIFAPVAFGIYKMARPAAIVALCLTGLGELGNLTALATLRSTLNSYAQYSAYQYQFQAQIQAVSSQYDYTVFWFLISAFALLAFTNATRGTMAYHNMVMNRQTADKQVAITRREFAGLKSYLFDAAGKLRAMAPKPAPVSGTVAVPTTPPVPRVDDSIRRVTEQPVAPAIVPDAPAVPVLPIPVVAPKKITFAQMIGADGRSIAWPRAAAFLIANVLAGLTYILWLTVTSPNPVAGIYWLYFMAYSAIFSVATVAVFWKVKKDWMAAAIAAAIAVVVAIPFCSLLPTFIWGDLIYREQFQQFVLVPFLNDFVLLMGLAWAIPRVQPTPLALWVGAMAAEVLTPLMANILRAFGAGQPPDKLIAGTSVVFAVIRSLLFAFSFWGLLRLIERKRTAS